MQTQMLLSHFYKGAHVEVIKTLHNSFYPATVLRAPTKQKSLVFVEYQTLFVSPSSSEEEHEPPKRLREYINVANVRPKLPQELNLWFKVGDRVDAYRENAWCTGVVKDILENSKCKVAFEVQKKKVTVVIEQCNLRLHRQWVDGSWVPPFPDQEKSPEVDTLSVNMRFKIKYSKRTRESMFKKGTLVEVSSDEEGYKGAWFTATIIDSIGNDKFLVQYRDLTTDDGSLPFKEEVNAKHIRPCPPPVSLVVSFEQFQEVDAWYSDGWWKGVVLEALNSGEYVVHFMPTNETMRFEKSKLRPHQDWINGEWVMASKKSSELAKMSGDLMSNTMLTGNKLIFKCQKSSKRANESGDIMSKTNSSGNKFKLHLCIGAKVEVRSDEEGYQGAWYTAIVVGVMQNGKYLVEYQTLKTDDFTEQLKEEADASDIRPCPPDVNHLHRFRLHDWVDAWYNDGWWVGQVSSVLRGWKYKVYFWPTNEVLDFEHCHLRLHQEWINGKWVVASSG